MKRREFVKGVSILGLSAVVKPSMVLAGGIPVIDAANLSQSVLEAVRALQSNVNEAMMIANQVKSLANDLKNLTKLPISIVDEFKEEFKSLFEAVGSVQGLMRDFKNLQSNFEELYPDFNKMGGFVGSEVISDKAEKWLSESRAMIEGASLTGAKVLENLPATQAQLEKLMVNSQSAVGILQAAQAGNQIAGTISGNLMNLSTQLATYSQAHMSYLQKINSNEAAAQNRLKRMLDPKPVAPANPVAMRPF